MPARPSDNGVLEQGKALGSEERGLRGNGMSGLCNKRETLRIWTEFYVWRAAVRRNFDNAFGVLGFVIS